jgi:hypothetical protein
MAAASWHANPTGARLANPLRAHYCLDLDRGQGRVRPHPSIPAANHDKILPNFVATTKQGQELIASTIVNVAHQSKAHAPLYTTLNTAARMAMRLPLGWACRPIHPSAVATAQRGPTGRRGRRQAGGQYRPRRRRGSARRWGAGPSRHRGGTSRPSGSTTAATCTDVRAALGARRSVASFGRKPGTAPSTGCRERQGAQHLALLQLALL